MWQSTRRCARLFTAIIYVAVLSGAALADTWTAPASEFANNIAAKTGPGSISISFSNRSSLAASEASTITSQIQSQLQARGVRLVQPEQAVTFVAITLSENTQGYLWVCEIKRGPSADILMTAVPRALSPTSGGSNLVTLRRKLILTSDDAILDVAIDGEGTVVLSPEKVSRYRAQDSQLQEIATMPIRHSRPFPSDVRGRITTVRGGQLEVSLPGVHCVQPNPQHASLECTDTDDPWPMSSPVSPVAVSAFFSPLRNFFTGAVTFRNAPNTQPADRNYDLPPFYSVAQIDEAGLPLWVFSGVDGQVRFLGGTRSQAPTETTFRNWGSDIAAITTACNNQRFVVATRDSDFTQPDTIQPFHIVNREAIAASTPVNFAGPITALWTSATSSDSVIAVSHNINTGKYEAYSLSLVCNQ